MRFDVHLEYFNQPAEMAWLCNAEPKNVLKLGTPLQRLGLISVIGATGISNSPAVKAITFDATRAAVLNLGTSDRCLVVDLGNTAGPRAIKSNSATSTEAETSVTKQGTGDTEFIAACKSEGLPESRILLVSDFLSGVREFSQDELVEGKSRKWVTNPKNFLAITIQNRNLQFCIHVKKTASLDRLKGTLDIRDDRPGYARFWLSERVQLDEALAAARSSFGN